MRPDLGDAYELLGLEPGARAEDIAAAYRARAKAEHPDHSDEQHAAERMAAVNAAHDVLTAALLTGIGETQDEDAAPAAAGPRRGADAAPPPPRPAGHWLAPSVRRALGPELLEELAEGERVDAVAAAATWASPRTVLAITDRRLLWLLDDAVGGRVRSLRYRQLGRVQAGTRGRVRRTGALTVHPRGGRKVTFTELPVEVAEAMARRIEAGMAAHGAGPTTF